MKISTALLNNKFAVGLIVSVIVYLVIIKPMINRPRRNLEAEKLDGLNVNDNDLTLTDIQASDLANQLFEKMDGFNWMGAEPAFWLEVMSKAATSSDALLISKKFGIRDGETLIEWLRSETSLKFLNFRKLILKKFTF